MAAFSWLGFTYLKQHHVQLKYTADVEHAYTALITSQFCENLVLDAETKQRGYLLTKNSGFRTTSYISISKIDFALRALRQITSDNTKQWVNTYLLQMAIRQKLAILRVISICRTMRKIELSG